MFGEKTVANTKTMASCHTVYKNIGNATSTGYDASTDINSQEKNDQGPPGPFFFDINIYMWILIISLYAHQPLGITQSKGIIQAPQPSYDVCMKERDRIKASWHTDGYTVFPRCVYIKHYSTDNGAYRQE